jgi:hypothetical protein
VRKADDVEEGAKMRVLVGITAIAFAGAILSGCNRPDRTPGSVAAKEQTTQAESTQEQALPEDASEGDGVRRHPFESSLAKRPDELAAGSEGRRVAEACRRLKGEPQAKEVAFLAPVETPASEGLWLVLKASVSEAEEDYLPWKEFYRDIELLLCQHRNGAADIRWKSGGLANWFGDPFCCELELVVTDLTGDGAPNAYVRLTQIGASWEPTVHELFALSNDGLTSIGTVRSEYPNLMEDVDGNGVYEAVDIHTIGATLCHAEQPGWHDYYTYVGSEYRLANERFPEQFEGWREKLTDILAEHPDDWVIWKHLGMVHEIQGDPSDAFAAYVCGEATCRAWLRKSKEELPEYSTAYEEALKDISARAKRVEAQWDPLGFDTPAPD